MKTKKSFWIGSILINLFGIMYLRWFFNQSFNGLFGGLAEVLLLFICLFVYLFIHLLFFKEFKIKFLVSLVDLFPIILLIIGNAIRDSEYRKIFTLVMVFYLVPVLIISALNLGIQQLFGGGKKKLPICPRLKYNPSI